MKLFAAVAVASLLALSAAKADPSTRYVPLGYCQLTSLASATALSACSGGIPTGATMFDLICETQAIRYRDDNVAPTATIGQPLAVGVLLNKYSGTLSQVQLIQQTASATCDILFYR